MQVVREPTPSEAVAWLRDAVAGSVVRRRTVLIVASCRVRYHGRAESRAGLGQRIVLLKGDGTLLVHNPEGAKPINWQPAGATFLVEAHGGDPVLLGRRKRPPETVRIHLAEVLLLASFSLRDESVFAMKGTEFDLRDALYRTPHRVEAGFRPWTREKATARGPMDLYGEDAEGNRLVVELKRTRAGIAEATQLWRYVERERQARKGKVRGLLMAAGFSKRCLQMLSDHELEAKAIRWEDVHEVFDLAAVSQATLGGFR